MAYGYTVRKVDRNHAAIVQSLRNLHYKVWDTHSVGCGGPDLVVLTPWGCLELVEIKMPSEGLTEDEARWHRDWKVAGGHVHIAYSADQLHQDLLKEHRHVASS